MDYIRVTLDFEDRHYERKRADLNFRLDKVYDKIEELEDQLLAARAKKCDRDWEKHWY
jgi:site-specific DNA recombinase